MPFHDAAGVTISMDFPCDWRLVFGGYTPIFKHAHTHTKQTTIHDHQYPLVESIFLMRTSCKKKTPFGMAESPLLTVKSHRIRWLDPTTSR